jgi:S-adenosylmethionine synthetase
MLAKDHLVIVSGEVRMSPCVAAAVDVPGLIRRKWADIGYPDADRITVVNHLQVQSPELQASSDADGAGDQGIMCGYSTSETSSGLPKEHDLARRLCRRVQDLRISGDVPWLRADSKTQVTLDGSGRISRVVIAAQHAEEVEGRRDAEGIQKIIKAVLFDKAVLPVLGDEVAKQCVSVNGTGSFTIGGPIGDCGVVGRKIVVDAYGPHVPVGGGAYSGKDPTKVDRSAAYMARHIARTAQAMGIRGAKAVTVHIAYCIGLHQPDMVTAVTDTDIDISDWVRSRFPDLSPRAIIEALNLWRAAPGLNWRYQDAAAWGHYGQMMFPWEGIANVSD